MNAWRFAAGAVLLLVAIGLLALTRWAMRRSSRPVQQAVLVAPLSVGTGVLICGVFLVLTAG